MVFGGEAQALTSAVEDRLESFAGGDLSGAFDDGMMLVVSSRRLRWHVVVVWR
jgi:hypothetical protein